MFILAELLIFNTSSTEIISFLSLWNTIQTFKKIVACFGPAPGIDFEDESMVLVY